MSGRPPTQHGYHVADANHQRVRSSVTAPRGHGDAQLETRSDQVVVDEGELPHFPLYRYGTDNRRMISGIILNQRFSHFF